MSSLKHSRIPPLGALRGFEAAARLGSFSRAAEEQGMTQSAISHHVKNLEDFFGQPLFERIGRRVRLTDAGQDFLETARRSLRTLSNGVRKLDSYLNPGQVVISTSPSLAANWLLPLFDDLLSRHPNVQPWLYTTDEYVDFERVEVDVAVRWGAGDLRDLKSVKLMDDWITPLCSPEILSSLERAQLPPDMSGFRLLYDEREDGWSAWFESVGVDPGKMHTGLHFSDPGLMLDSAIAGHGIALGSLLMADRHIREGRLCRPFASALKTSESYYAVCLEQNLQRPPVKQLWDWLIDQSQSCEQIVQNPTGVST